MKPGAVLSEVYDKVKDYILSKRSKWADKITATFGYGVLHV
jgi:hypothetical protein